jgi:uncharacterized DUF497 family protein
MFEWEEARRARNMEEFGVDFVRAAAMFDNPILEREDTRQFHGEKRFLAMGQVDGFFMVVAWTPRANRRRIIQAWRADRDDEAIYRATVPFSGPQVGGLHTRHGLPTGKPWSGLLDASRPALSLPRTQAGAAPAGSGNPRLVREPEG